MREFVQIVLDKCIEALTHYQENSALTTECVSSEKEELYALKMSAIDTSYSLYNWLDCRKTNDIATRALLGLAAKVEELHTSEPSDLYRGSIQYFVDRYSLSQIHTLLEIEKQALSWRTLDNYPLNQETHKAASRLQSALENLFSENVLKKELKTLNVYLLPLQVDLLPLTEEIAHAELLVERFHAAKHIYHIAARYFSFYGYQQMPHVTISLHFCDQKQEAYRLFTVDLLEGEDKNNIITAIKRYLSCVQKMEARFEREEASCFSAADEEIEALLSSLRE
jgi:hypothetical protein